MAIGIGLLLLAAAELAVAASFLVVATRMSAWPVQVVPVTSPRLTESSDGSSWLGTARLPDGRELTVNIPDAEVRDIPLHVDPAAGRVVETGFIASRRRLGLILLPAGCAMLVAGIVLLTIG